MSLDVPQLIVVSRFLDVLVVSCFLVLILHLFSHCGALLVLDLELVVVRLESSRSLFVSLSCELSRLLSVLSGTSEELGDAGRLSAARVLAIEIFVVPGHSHFISY